MYDSSTAGPTNDCTRRRRNTSSGERRGVSLADAAPLAGRWAILFPLPDRNVPNPREPPKASRQRDRSCTFMPRPGAMLLTRAIEVGAADVAASVAPVDFTAGQVEIDAGGRRQPGNQSMLARTVEICAADFTAGKIGPVHLVGGRVQSDTEAPGRLTNVCWPVPSRLARRMSPVPRPVQYIKSEPACPKVPKKRAKLANTRMTCLIDACRWIVMDSRRRVYHDWERETTKIDRMDNRHRGCLTRTSFDPNLSLNPSVSCYPHR
jgi:hypothetical protein